MDGVMGNRRKNNVTDEQILESYQRLQSGNKVADELGIGTTTVHRVLTKRGINCIGLVKYRTDAMKFKGQEAQIREFYESGKTFKEIRQILGGGSDYAIRYALKRAGGRVRLNAPYRVKPGEVDLIRKLHESGMGQIPISLQIGRSQSFVSRTMRKFGIHTHFPQGETHPQWKGGKFKTSGRWMISVPANDPICASMRNSSGYVLEHRAVVARSIGRPLDDHETIHHIDGDSLNNDISNLQLRTGRHGKHVRLKCADCGSHNIISDKL